MAESAEDKVREIAEEANKKADEARERYVDQHEREVREAAGDDAVEKLREQTGTKDK